MRIGLNAAGTFERSNHETSNAISHLRVLSPSNSQSKQIGELTAYEGKDEKTGTILIAMQPLVADQAYMPQMKAMCVPFHMMYGRLMCY